MTEYIIFFTLALDVSSLATCPVATAPTMYRAQRTPVPVPQEDSPPAYGVALVTDSTDPGGRLICSQIIQESKRTGEWFKTLLEDCLRSE